MIKKFKILFGNFRNRLFGVRYKTVLASLGGRELRVHKGTIRQKPDKDDAWLAYLLRDKKVIFDIGANIGYTALMANVYGNPDELILVDPNPKALASAATNLIENNLSMNCRFLPAFVSDKSQDKVKFFTIGRGAAGSIFSNHAKSAANLDSWFWVETVTLDEVAARYKLTPDLVKIDVEGAEYSVLKGASTLARAGTVLFFVEMHSNRDLPMLKNAEHVINWCEEFSYMPWYLRSGEALTKPETIAHRGKCHLLLLPKGMPYPEVLKGIPQGADLPIIN
jgi:FkbM family methyltransferase